MKSIVNYKIAIAALSLFLLASVSLYAGQGIFHFSSWMQRAGIESMASVAVAQKVQKAKKIKIALLLDTSNSMDGLIDQAKSQLWSIVNELATAKCDSLKPEIQIALYEYGNDRLPSNEGFIRLVTPLTNDLDKISESLFGLSTLGGSEFCGHVIQTATRQLDWSSNTEDLQIIFIAGNEPFNQGSVDYKQACNVAKEKNIIINTIFCGDFNEGIRTWWKQGADLTNGSYMSIQQNSKTVFIPSPYDDQLDQLNTKLNDTYIEYGREGKIKKEVQISQDKNAEKYGLENKVNRTISKSTHVYKNTTWDLVDASDEQSFDITKITQEQLPDTMKKMTNEQKLKYIADKKTERQKIKQEIVEISKQRESYLAEERKKSVEKTDMLDKTMINSIKKQAETKNFKFEENSK